MLSLTGTQIKQALAETESIQRNRFSTLLTPQDLERFRPSAVIMPLLIIENEWHLLFTHRSPKLIDHSGQVSFPGGARDQGDKSLEETALREMQEEIGISPQDVVVFGSLGEMPVVTGYLVRVFVGQIPWPYALKINHEEVKDVFTVPLRWLADPGHRMTRYRNYAGREIPVIFFDLYEGYQLWGASAEMTVALLDVLQLSA